MPLLSREPETPYIQGLLVLLGVLLLVSVVRYFPFFLHQVVGIR